MSMSKNRTNLIGGLFGTRLRRAAALTVMGSLAAISLVACGSSVQVDVGHYSDEPNRADMFGVGSNPAVNAEIGNGDIELVLGAADSITVTAELKKPESVEYIVTRDGDTITVIAKTRNGSKADVTVTVPVNTTFSLTTGSGDVDVPAVNASGHVSSGSGSLTLVNTDGDVTGSTGSGNVKLTGASGTFRLSTGSENIDMTGVSGTFNQSTGSGSITLRDSTGSFSLSSGSGNVKARESDGSFGLSSGSGDVEFQGELALGSENNFSSGSGSVTAKLTGSPSVDLDLEIEQKGKVRVDLTATVREQSEHRFAGTVGGGDAALTVRVGDGDIVVE